MKNTTFTFSALSNQTPVELIDDPSKPGWDNLTSATELNKEEDEFGETVAESANDKK